MFDRNLYDFNGESKKKDSLYRSFAVQFGLSETSFWILYVLRSNFALMTQRDLCAYLSQPKQSINTGLKKLAELSYIELSNGEDKRSKYITLTQKGKDFAKETIDLVIEAERKALTGLSKEEQNKMFDLFHQYNDLLEERLGLLYEISKEKGGNQDE